MKKQFETLAVAYHEAGHAITFLYHGCKVEALHCSDTGGFCLPARIAGPQVRALAATAGARAARMAGYGDVAGYESDEDTEHGIDAMGNLSMCRDSNRQRLAECETVLAKCWPQVEYLAGKLAEAGNLDADDIRALTRERGSRLATYAALYPRVKALSRPKGLRRVPGIVTVARKGLFMKARV